MRGSASTIVSIHSGLTFLPKDVTRRLSLRPCTVTKPSRSISPRSPGRHGLLAGPWPRNPPVNEGPSPPISPPSTQTKNPPTRTPPPPDPPSPRPFHPPTHSHP